MRCSSTLLHHHHQLVLCFFSIPCLVKLIYELPNLELHPRKRPEEISYCSIGNRNHYFFNRFINPLIFNTWNIAFLCFDKFRCFTCFIRYYINIISSVLINKKKRAFEMLSISFIQHWAVFQSLFRHDFQ